MYGLSFDDLVDKSARFMVLISGVDELFADTVHAHRFYTYDEVRENYKFMDMIHGDPVTGKDYVDYRYFHQIEPIAGLRQRPDRRYPQTEGFPAARSSFLR